MAKDYAKKFYKSTAWLKCRASYIKSVYGLCERCGSPGHVVHHIQYITPDNVHDPDVTLNHDNLEYLCQDCHNREHHKTEEITRDGLTFDDKGQLIPAVVPPVSD